MENLKQVIKSRRQQLQKLKQNKLMLKSIQGVIESCEVKKTGISEKTNKRWTIYGVTINGEQFSTFDAAYKNHIGQKGTFEYEEKPSPDGQYINRTLSKYPETVINTGHDKDININDIIRGFGILRGDIQRLEKTFDERLSRLASVIESIGQQPEISGEVNMPTADNSQEDIPIINEAEN